MPTPNDAPGGPPEILATLPPSQGYGGHSRGAAVFFTLYRHSMPAYFSLAPPRGQNRFGCGYAAAVHTVASVRCSLFLRQLPKLNYVCMNTYYMV